MKHGCICISWNTRESVVFSLTALAKEKIEFMKHIGVLRLSIGEITIFDHEQWGLQEEQEQEKECYLVQSIASNCTEAVEFLLNTGANPNHRIADGKTVLCLASMNGFTKISKLLIDAGACVNLADACNPQMTPLMLACSKTHKDTVHLLLQSEADPNHLTDTRLTALLCVDYSNCCSLGIVRSLLEAGAAVNTQDSAGWSSAIGNSM